MSHTVPFWKAQSIGNDFVLVHSEDAPDDVAWELLARSACDRKFGVGADGLLVLSRDLVLRMFNPDGTEDFCGNGLRCAAMHARRLGWAGETFTMQHLGHSILLRARADGQIETDLEPASYDPLCVPTTQAGPIMDQRIEVGSRSWLISTLSTGTAHTIIPVVTLPDDSEFVAASQAIEHHAWFPERTSVMWVVQENDDELRMRVWERGVGETMGCGTGSTAAVIDHMRRRGRGGTVAVHNPGGTLWVKAEAWDAPITVIGRAEEVFRGSFHEDFVRVLRLPQASGAC